MHLRVADPLGDLRLGHVLDEAQAQDHSLALLEVGQRRVEGDPSLDQLEALVLFADPFRGRCLVGVLGAGRPVERERPAVVVGLHHLEHVGLLQPEALGDLADRGRALQFFGQLGDRFVDFGHAVVEPAGHPHGPDPVAEVALQLAEDRRRGEGGEGDAALGVEAVDGVEQAQVGDLEQVVEGLAGAAVAQRQALGEGHVAADQLFAHGGLAVTGEALPELAFSGQLLTRPQWG